MDVTTAMLADFAQVREGLLFVVVGRDHPLLPRAAPRAARRVPRHRARARPARGRAAARGAASSSSTRTVSELAEIAGEIQLGETQLMINENLNLPITFDLRNVPVERFGAVEVRLYVARRAPPHPPDLGDADPDRPTARPRSARSPRLLGGGNGLRRRWADVVGARADEPVVGGLLEDVGAPADDAARRERRREHLAGQAAACPSRCRRRTRRSCRAAGPA